MNGETATGLLIHDDAQSISLVDAAGTTNTFSTTDVATRKLSNVSAMPEGLQAGLSPQEFTDLISYLQNLK